MTRADEVWDAFRDVFSKLSPEERAALVLRQVYAAGYDEIARVLGLTESECRELVRRARERMRDGRPG